MHPSLTVPLLSFLLMVLPLSERKTNKSILSNPVHLPNTVLSAFTYIFSFNGFFAYLLQWRKWNWDFGCSSPSLSALAFRSHWNKIHSFCLSYRSMAKSWFLNSRRWKMCWSRRKMGAEGSLLPHATSCGRHLPLASFLDQPSSSGGQGSSSIHPSLWLIWHMLLLSLTPSLPWRNKIRQDKTTLSPGDNGWVLRHLAVFSSHCDSDLGFP